MKRLSFIVVLLVIATGAFAQFVQSNATQTNTAANTNSGNLFSKMTKDNYSRFYIGYNPVSVNWEEYGSMLKKALPMKNGLSLGYMHANNIVKSLPLYVEYGANLVWMYGNANEKSSVDSYSISVTTENKFNMFSVNVPVNLAFRLSFANNDFSVTPYLGLNFRINLAGTRKETATAKAEYDGESYKATAIVKYKLFSSDEPISADELLNSDKKDFVNNDAWEIEESENEITMKATTGMGDFAFKRFQVGFNVGVAVNYKKLHLGFGYVADFNRIVNSDTDEYEFACRLGVPTISLGVAF